MKPKFNRKSNGAFTLVEIIGVMAIIGILGAVVAPRVIDGIREGRVTQLAQNVGQWKSGADRYLQKHQIFPVDGTQQPKDPITGNAGTYPQGGEVALANSTFGDILVTQGLVASINVPFGPNVFAPAASGTDVTAVSNITAVTPASDTYAQIRCAQFTGANSAAFTATRTRDVPYRVVFLLIPDVPLQEAASIKTKIDGPFPGVQSDVALLTDAISQTLGGSGVAAANQDALFRGNCRVAQGTSASLYDLYIYITND
jgi:type II secretory pathway pseudopilin PulG